MKQFNEFIGSDNGLYVAIKYHKNTSDKIVDIMNIINVPNPVAADTLHTTIHYSRKQFSWCNEPYSRFMNAIGELDVWNTNEGNVLVMKLSGPIADHLRTRHELGIACGATYDYNEYIPHITLSYDCGEFEVNSQNKVHKLHLNFIEYSEDLKD